MPRAGQIIPEYLHPHVQTYINDNTIFEEVVNPAPDGTKFLAVFISGKGRDNVLLPIGTNPEYIEEFGKPNYKLYGQAGYMPYAYLYSNQATGWCMRLAADDATYANVVVLAKVKVEDATDSESTSKLKIYHEAKYLTGIIKASDFSALVEAMTDPDPDENGYVTYPLFGVRMLGRGKYGETFRIRVSSAPQADKDNDYKNFRLEVIDSDGGIQRKELFTGSFYGEAKDTNGNTIFLPDLLTDSDDGSSKIAMYVVEDSFETIYNMYKTVVPDTEITLDVFDLITGKTKAGTDIPNLVIDNSVAGAVSLDKVEGVAFAGGDDGAFAVGAPGREEAINAAYIKAFNGELDRSILSKRRCPAELIMDANYADEVKRALINLMLKRYDAFGYVDGGILNTPTEAIEWAESMANLGDKVFSKECMSYDIKDPFSGKVITMTATYFLAMSLPTHFKVNGKQTPFTGETFAKVTGHVKGSVRPIIDADDFDIKERLYNLRVNYFECVAEDTFVRGTQGTSQNVWSDLSEENNMHNLLEMKRKIEAIVASKTYNFAEAEDRKKFTEQAERLLSDYIGPKVRSATVSFAMNKFEEERSILHCYLEVTFRTMSKRGIIEIDINKRV